MPCPKYDTFFGQRKDCPKSAASFGQDKGWHKRVFRSLANVSLIEKQDALARDWLEADPDSAATLCVDGHVKVYTGRKGHLKRHFVARRKLCLPAAASYWLNALDERPFVCLQQDLDPGLVQALRSEVVPCLRELGSLPANWEVAQGPAVTLVFEREGWSPKLFRELARQGVACITWHKGRQASEWHESAFRTMAVPINAPGGQTCRTARLAERQVELLKGFEVREIRRRLDDGRQAALLTTHPDLSMERVAGALLSRWTQENYFNTCARSSHWMACPSTRWLR